MADRSLRDICGSENVEILLNAAERGDVGLLRQTLDGGTDVDARGRTGWTALLRAAACARAEAFHMLVAEGADLTVRDADGNTALHFAAQTDQVELARLLLDRGLEVDTRNVLQSTPLMWAARSGSAGVAKLLLDAGANVNAGNKRGLTALQAAYGRDVKKLLKQAGATTEPHDDWEPTPTERFLEAAENGDVPTLREMLDGGLPIDSCIGWGNTALARAVARGQLAAVELLLEAGADPQVRGSDGDTLLGSAAFVEDAALMQRLLETGIDVNEPDENGFTPLMGACYQGDLHSVKLLVQAGADLNARGSFAIYDDKTSMQYASQERKRRVVKYLEQVGLPADPAQEAFDEIKQFVQASQQPAFQELLNDLESLCESGSTRWRQSRGVYRIDVRARAYPRLAERFGEGANALVGLRRDEAALRRAELLLRLQREVYSAGCLLIQGQPDASTGMLLFPTSNPNAAVAACGTEGPNNGVATSDVIGWLHKLNNTHPFLLTACARDCVGGQFREPVSGAGELAERMVKFCPDLLDGDILDSVSALANVLESTQEFFLGWD
jgi:ankyrin repeat protein